MNANSSNSILWAMVLVALGIAAFFGGTGWLVVVLPAAMLVWFGARPIVASGRN